MALPTKINNQYGFANMELNGGKGSGNFGHAGRPGEIGGSGSGGGKSAEDRAFDKVMKAEEERDKYWSESPDQNPAMYYGKRSLLADKGLEEYYSGDKEWLDELTPKQRKKAEEDVKKYIEKDKIAKKARKQFEKVREGVSVHDTLEAIPTDQYRRAGLID